MFLSTFKGTFCTINNFAKKNHIIRFLSSFWGNINTNSFLLLISMIFMKMIFFDGKIVYFAIWRDLVVVLKCHFGNIF